MATFFGEVIHPTSRAFWNDDDSEDDDENLENSEENIEFKFDWIEPEPSDFNKLLVIEGEMSTDFVKKFILKDAKVICNIIGESNDNCTKIYLLDVDIYICLVSTKVVLEQAGEFTQTIAPLLKKSKYIYTVTADHILHYKTDEELNSISFLKTLCSRKARNNKNFCLSPLKIPNIVTGVCAGVLSYSEITDLSCVLYILYADSFSLDSKNASPLIELFSELIGKTPVFTAADSSFFNKGNLYM